MKFLAKQLEGISKDDHQQGLDAAMKSLEQKRLMPFQNKSKIVKPRLWDQIMESKKVVGVFGIIILALGGCSIYNNHELKLNSTIYRKTLQIIIT